MKGDRKVLSKAFVERCLVQVSEALEDVCKVTAFVLEDSASTEVKSPPDLIPWHYGLKDVAPTELARRTKQAADKKAAAAAKAREKIEAATRKREAKQRRISEAAAARQSGGMGVEEIEGRIG